MPTDRELAQQKWAAAQHVERDLISQFKADEAPLIAVIDELLLRLRTYCQDTIFLDFEYSTKEGIEKRLWDAHCLVNDRYRKRVLRYKEGEQRKHHVERRKHEKHYADFIKTCQYFYKGFIQRLASNYAGMIGLRRIAHRLSLSVLSVDERIQVSPDVERMIEDSCHSTLLRLGDLSRYRNTIRTKDRSWEAALGYYALANDLYPDSGSAHNQIAVISISDGNHFDAVYRIYRALSVKEPQKQHYKNLKVELKTIRSEWDKRVPLPKTDSLGAMLLWFTRLHAKYYEGEEFPTREELENEVLSRLARMLREQAFEEVLEKLVLTNIAAEAVAINNIEGADGKAVEKQIHSFCFLLHFNIRTMCTLLQVLKPELEDITQGEDLPNESELPRASPEKISSICRRVLPALRQYSIWLTLRHPLLAGVSVTGSLNLRIDARIKEMWQNYADVLTRLAKYFSLAEVSSARQSVEYLLEEDEIAVGFKPFHDDKQIPHECNFFILSDGNPKPRITDPGVERNHPNVEMQARVCDILMVALRLQVDDKIPLNFTDFTGSPIFSVGQATVFAAKGLDSAQNDAKETSSVWDSPPIQHNIGLSQEREAVPSSQKDPQINNNVYMSQIVDGTTKSPLPRLSEENPDETSYGMDSYTANDLANYLELNGPFHNHSQGHQQLQSTPKVRPRAPLPLLPEFSSSPFAPKPFELSPTSLNCPDTASQFSSYQFATDQQRIAAADELERVTGYGSAWPQSRGRELPQPSSTSSQTSPHRLPVNQSLQQSLALQFSPRTLSTNAFSDTSSRFASTPRLTALRRPADNTFTSFTSGQLTDYDREMMLQSSLADYSQTHNWGLGDSPPPGQGG